ncbi:MAG: STAS domain-containing protein [bacterium]
MQALQSGAHEILLDFSRLSFLNPNGVKALRESLELAKQHEANLGISSPQPQVRRALKLSGIAPQIPIYFNEMEAIMKLDLIDYQETAVAESTDCLLICQKEIPIARSLRNSLKEMSSKTHYRMVPVRELKRAFQTLLEEKIDCIMIDSSFPLFQVTQFIEQVATDTRLPRIPILVVTSDEKLDEADLIVRNGANEILRYPFKGIEVSIRLQTLISHMKDHRPFHPPDKVVQPRGWRA